MKPFRKFYFKKFEFDFDTLEWRFFYNFDKKEFFEERINFSSKLFKTRKDLDKRVINNMMFNIHLALWISYYKLYPTKELLVCSWYLDQGAMAFWAKFYRNWLWEFLYQNEISPKKLFNFMNMNMSAGVFEKVDFTLKDRSLIALWWGKDSLVSVDLYKKAGLKFRTVVFGKMDRVKKKVSEKIWKKNLLIHRELSENLFKLNEGGYYNWHIPITWVTSFILLLSAYLYDYKYIVLSNEKSANLSNTTWKKLDINHQYSKSLEYEEDFREYVKDSIWGDIKYFSLLKWFYEFKIAELFSSMKEYFPIFSSCNNNFKIIKSEDVDKNEDEDKNKSGNKQEQENKETIFTKIVLWENLWCNSCPKCVFVYVILSAFLDKKILLKIFWQDLYQDKELENTFRELFWLSWIKPFECVWDKKELVMASKKALRNYKKKLPYNLDFVKKEILDEMSEKDFENLEVELNNIYKEDNIPQEINEKIEIFK